MTDFFKEAKPVWIKDRTQEMNCNIELTYSIEPQSNARLVITGATFYQIFANGELLHYGPARKAHGYAGVDVIDLPKYSDKTEISIRVAGYNCKCFGAAKNSSFVQAEILCGEDVIAATGKNGFEAYLLSKRIQKVMRYSYQRHFSESWDYTRQNEPCNLVEVFPGVKYIGRNVPFGSLDIKSAKKVGETKYYMDSEYRYPLYDYLTDPMDTYECFRDEEIERKPFCEYLRAKSSPTGDRTLENWDFGKIEVGFFKLDINAKSDGRIILAFAEQLDDEGRVALRPLEAVNVIEVQVSKGKSTFVSFEPYTVKYAEILIMEGDIDVTDLSVIELAYPAENIIPFHTDDAELMAIYEAAVNTFRHNAVDIYMDCPSRERAGWLFDSYYTAKAEFSLTGNSIVEDEFLNNYRLGGSRDDLGGMVDMCYPADVFSGNFIPQWSMWYILQLNEYFTRRGRIEKKDLFKEQVMLQVKYFENYENEFGLLEKLKGWNFVERSALNFRVHDVSWPTNMLYSKFLATVGDLYDRKDLIEKSEQIKATIHKMAFDGDLFCDRAMRTEDGKLVNTDERSETTQYYALFFGLAEVEEEKYKALKEIILGTYNGVEIEESDVMPGRYIKMELLLKYGWYDCCRDNIIKYFKPMVKETGTLWEHKFGKISRDHGFASFIAAVIKEISV